MRSFSRVRNRMDFTVFSFMPYRPAMTEMESTYQYRRRKRLQSFSGSVRRKRSIAAASSFCSSSCSTRPEAGMHSPSSSSAAIAPTS